VAHLAIVIIICACGNGRICYGTLAKVNIINVRTLALLNDIFFTYLLSACLLKVGFNPRQSIMFSSGLSLLFVLFTVS